MNGYWCYTFRGSCRDIHWTSTDSACALHTPAFSVIAFVTSNDMLRVFFSTHAPSDCVSLTHLLLCSHSYLSVSICSCPCVNHDPCLPCLSRTCPLPHHPTHHLPAPPPPSPSFIPSRSPCATQGSCSWRCLPPVAPSCLRLCCTRLQSPRCLEGYPTPALRLPCGRT